MKNSNFRNSFISTLTVTVVGVLLFGVNAALSETPTASPPGDGVAPTFTGVNIGTAWAKLQMVDVLDVKGKITNSIPFTAVTVNDAMEVAGTLIVSGDGATDVTFGTELTNGLGVTGDTLLNGDVTISGNISNVGNPITVDAGLVVTGDALVNGVKLTVANMLEIGTDLHIVGVIKNPSSGDEPVKVEDGLDVHGSILNTATEDAEGMTAMNADGTPLQIDLPVTIDDDVVVNKTLSVLEGISGNLSVTGKLTATTIGSYGTKTSDKVTINSGSNGVAETPACDGDNNGSADGILISCSMQAYNPSNGNVSEDAFYIRKMNLNPTTKKCSIRAKNTWTESRKLEATAYCFYPNL